MALPVQQRVIAHGGQRELRRAPVEEACWRTRSTTRSFELGTKRSASARGARAAGIRKEATAPRETRVLPSPHSAPARGGARAAGIRKEATAPRETRVLPSALLHDEGVPPAAGSNRAWLRRKRVRLDGSTSIDTFIEVDMRGCAMGRLAEPRWVRPC